MGGGAEGRVLLGQTGVTHSAAGLDSEAGLCAVSDKTLALIQTLIIRTISAELRLAGFRSVLGTLRQRNHVFSLTHTHAE